MVWLPVVERELRVAARKHATYRIRVLALVAVTTVLAWDVFAASQQHGIIGAADGPALFDGLAQAAGIFSILIGVFATSDSIGVEKREGTLGLLFLTDLKGYDVVCGKLVASSLNGFYALIAVLPVLGVPMLVGGVTFSQFLEVAGALVTATVFSLSAGIFVSAFVQNERKAMFMTFAFLSLITWGPLVISPTSPGGFLRVLSPARAILTALYIVPLRWVYFCSIAMSWFGTLLMLRCASRHTPRSWQEPAISPASFRPVQGRMNHPNRRLLDVNPFAWLAARGEADPRLVWVFLASILGLWLFFLLTKPWGLKPGDLFSNEVVGGTDLAVNTVLKIWIVSEACRRFAEDRGNGGFELLLSTPLSVRQIIRGQWLALWKQFSLPILALLAWDVVLGIGKPGAGYEAAGGEHWVAMFFLLADAFVLGLTGMWLGLTTQSRNRAILTGLLLVSTLPWLAGIAVIRAIEVSGNIAAVIECAIWGSVDLSVFLWAASRIELHFRRIATEGSYGAARASAQLSFVGSLSSR